MVRPARGEGVLFFVLVLGSFFFGFFFFSLFLVRIITKVLAPAMALRVIDRSIQAQGARGVSQDTYLPWMWAGARSLRLADGPDEVHRENIAKLELLKAKL